MKFEGGWLHLEEEEVVHSENGCHHNAIQRCVHLTGKYELNQSPQ